MSPSFIRNESLAEGMPVHIAERPLDCVVDGAGKRLGKPLGVQYKHDR